MNNELINKIIDSIENNPNDWHENDFTFKNNLLGIELWIKGALYPSIHKPVELEVGILAGFKLNSAIKKCKQNQLLNILNQEK